MAHYAIGEVRGRFDELQQLLTQIAFNKDRDYLSFCGNLINPNQAALPLLQFVISLENKASLIIGHNEIALLRCLNTHNETFAHDAFDDVYGADSDTQQRVTHWLKNQPLLQRVNGYTLVHAGIPPQWSLSQSVALATELSFSLSSGNLQTFLLNTEGDTPTLWHAKHRGWNRQRFILNALTRLRGLNEKKRLVFDNAVAQSELRPWFQANDRVMENEKIVFARSPTRQHGLPKGIFPLNCAQDDTLTALELGDTVVRHQLRELVS